MEKVERFKFLGVHITDKLKWSTHTDSVVKKAQQYLFNLRKLKKCGLSPKTLTNVYRCTIKSILLVCITGWYGNCTTINHRALQRVVRSAQCTTGSRMSQKGQKIIKDNNQDGVAVGRVFLSCSAPCRNSFLRIYFVYILISLYIYGLNILSYNPPLPMWYGSAIFTL